jgi:hypothetical protein
LELGSDDRRVDLQAAEIQILLKACRKYRASIPSYLQSVQTELALVSELLLKLENLTEPPDDSDTE